MKFHALRQCPQPHSTQGRQTTYNDASFSGYCCPTVLLRFCPIAARFASWHDRGMDGPYEDLRREAATKRDKIIAAARQEYRVALTRIKTLHRQVTGQKRVAIAPPRRKPQTLTDLLCAALPRDKPFTVADACALMYESPLTCGYRETSIRSQIRVLSQAGKIRQVGRHNGHVLWVRAESPLRAGPFGSMTLAEIAEQLIRQHGPMRVPEIVASMREAGYKPDESPRRTAVLLRQALGKISGRFVKDDLARWSAQ